MPRRVIIIVLDSVGIGEMSDAEQYGDLGSNTPGNIARYRGGLDLPQLERLGLGSTFADLGATVAEYLETAPMLNGKSFLEEIQGGLFNDFGKRF